VGDVMKYYDGEFVICRDCGSARTGNIKFIRESPCPICTLKENMMKQEVKIQDRVFIECPDCKNLIAVDGKRHLCVFCGYEEMEVKE
jgi:hypothetical protein